jgi:hypothetical protein
MAELVKRIDSKCDLHSLFPVIMDPHVRLLDPLATHMDEHGVEYMQFAFRWMNCLLMREISVKCTIRMWDTYLVRVIIR